MTKFTTTGAALCLAATTLFAPVGAFAGPPATETSEASHADAPSQQDAMALQNEGRWDEAAKAWSQIVKAHPENGRAVFNLGYCLHAGGHLEKALEVHHHASQFDDFRGIALYNAGCANALLGNRDDALALLQASREAGFDIGAARDDSDFDSMRDDVRLDMLLGGGGPEGWGGGMANAPSFRDRLMQGVAQARGMLREYAPEAEQRAQGMLQQMAMQAQQRLGEFMQDERYAGMFAAVQEFMQDPRVQQGLQSLAQDERFAPIMQRFMGGGPMAGDQPGGYAEMESSDSAEAWVEATESAEAWTEATSKPEQVPTLQEAQRYQGSGDWEEAVAAYGAILESDPENVAANFGFAYCTHMSGDYEAAIVAHKRAAEYEQIRGISLYNLGCALALTDHPEKAIAALRAADEAGFDVLESMENDSDLDSLRDNDAFAELIMDLRGDI